MPTSPVDPSLATLSWLLEAGADEAVLETPVNRIGAGRVPAGAGFTPRAAAAARDQPAMRHHTSDLPGQKRGTTVSAGRSAASSPASEEDHVGRAMEIAAGCNSLAELRAALEAFEGCALKQHATKTVFADGSPAARIMLIGEAPGRDEDARGLPFVGKAGQLLDRMLAAIGLDRASNVYITNVLPWRPPENRNPDPTEIAKCIAFLRRHIELASPKIILLLGAVSTRNVLGRPEGITQLRGKWLEYFVGGEMVPVMPTLHPAYLLRQPAHKKLVWRDLLAVEAKIKSLGLLELSNPSL